jgi:hypothetical protein
VSWGDERHEGTCSEVEPMSPAPGEVQVRMSHPDTDTDAFVAADAVEAWEESGWKVADQAEADDAVEAAAELEAHHDEVTGAAQGTDDKPKAKARGAAKSTHAES